MNNRERRILRELPKLPFSSNGYPYRADVIDLIEDFDKVHIITHQSGRINSLEKVNSKLRQELLETRGQLLRFL